MRLLTWATVSIVLKGLRHGEIRARQRHIGVTAGHAHTQLTARPISRIPSSSTGRTSLYVEFSSRQSDPPSSTAECVLLEASRQPSSISKARDGADLSLFGRHGWLLTGGKVPCGDEREGRGRGPRAARHYEHVVRCSMRRQRLICLSPSRLHITSSRRAQRLVLSNPMSRGTYSPRCADRRQR